MMRRRSAALPVLASIFWLLGTRSAGAETTGCAPLDIAVDARLAARWPALSAEIAAAFQRHDDIDRCARVALSARGSGAVVQVALPDGRAAARSVARRDDVVPTLESLLLLPQRPAEPAAATVDSLEPEPAAPTQKPAPNVAAARASTRAVTFQREVGVPTRDTAAVAPVKDASHSRIELSALAGARMGDGQLGLGVGAASFLDLSGWLVGFEARADRYRTVVQHAEGTLDRPSDGGALELALLAGRRFQLQTVALDLSAGPAAAMQGTTTVETYDNGKMVTRSSSSTAPRLLLGARMSFDAQATVHTFVSVDGEVGAARVGPSLPSAPRLPVWTLGLSLGATVGTK